MHGCCNYAALPLYTFPRNMVLIEQRSSKPDDGQSIALTYAYIGVLNCFLYTKYGNAFSHSHTTPIFHHVSRIYQSWTNQTHKMNHYHIHRALSQAQDTPSSIQPKRFPGAHIIFSKPTRTVFSSSLIHKFFLPAAWLLCSRSWTRDVARLTVLPLLLQSIFLLFSVDLFCVYEKSPTHIIFLPPVAVFLDPSASSSSSSYISAPNRARRMWCCDGADHTQHIIIIKDYRVLFTWICIYKSYTYPYITRDSSPSLPYPNHQHSAQIISTTTQRPTRLGTAGIRAQRKSDVEGGGSVPVVVHRQSNPMYELISCILYNPRMAQTSKKHPIPDAQTHIHLPASSYTRSKKMKHFAFAAMRRQNAF